MLEFIPNRNDAFQEGVDKEQDIREEIGEGSVKHLCRKRFIE